MRSARRSLFICEYQPRAPVHGVRESEVGRGVAGVERHHDVRLERRRVVRDVAHLEAQSVVPVAPRGLRAFLYDVPLEVESDYLHRTLQYLRKVVVHNKGKIALAAPEVYYTQGAVGLERFAVVVYNLEEAVYLAELVVWSGRPFPPP